MNEAIDPITLELAPDATQATELLAYQAQVRAYLIGERANAPDIRSLTEARATQVVLKGLADTKLRKEIEKRFIGLSLLAAAVVNSHDPITDDFIRGNNLADATFRVNIGGSR